MNDDMIETAGGLVPLANGWWLDTQTGYKVSPSGLIYDKDGNQVGETIYDSEDPEY